MSNQSSGGPPDAPDRSAGQRGTVPAPPEHGPIAVGPNPRRMPRRHAATAMSFDPGSPAPLIQNAYGEAAGGPGASSEPAGLYVDIFHENGSHRSVVFTKSEITIGRDKVNDLVLADEGVSRRHAQITVDEHGDCSVVDLGSTNGTIVNDEPIGRATASLDADDLVALGPFGLRVRYVTEPASEPAAAPAGPPQAASPAPPPPKTSPPGPPPPARPSSAPPPQRPGSKLGPPPPARPRSVPPPPPKAARPPPPRSAPPPPQTGPAEPSSPPAAPPPAAAPPSPQPRSPLPAAPEAAPAEVHAGPADGGPPFDEIVDPPTEANTLAELATNNVGRPWDAAEAARLAPTPGQDLPPMPAEASSAAAPDPTSAPQPAPEATAAAEPPDAVPPPSPQAVIAAEAHPPEPVSPEPVSPEPVSLETPEPTGQTTVEEEDLELAEPEIRPSEEEAVADEANLDVLVEAGVCSRFMASSLRDVLDAGLGVLVTGDDSSTEPVVRALAASVGSEDHLVWLVESEEDQPPDEATVAVLGEGEERLGTLEALASLEGDRVVTPPLRGTDLLALLEATSDGCDGLLMAATGHCIEAAVARISASIIAAKPGLDFNAATIWVAAAFPITIEMGCRRDGTRIITRIAELSVETPGAALDLWQYDLEEGFSESAPAPPIREWLKLRGYGTD